MLVKPLKDPRTFDWGEMGNLGRQMLEPFVKYTADFTFEPVQPPARKASDATASVG